MDDSRSDGGTEAGDALDAGDEEVGAELAADDDAFLGALPHFYRSEVSQADSAQTRLDRPTNWAITVIAALLSVVFSGPNMPTYLLLIGVVALSVPSPSRCAGTASTTCIGRECGWSRRTSSPTRWTRRVPRTKTGAGS